MSKLKNILIAGGFSLFSMPLLAQSNCDPWIVSIYKQVYNRQVTAEECNIRNYNNGSWSSYEQLTQLIKQYQNRKNSRNSNPVPAGDPWVIEIYQYLYGRVPNATELKISNYNNGSWSSKEQLTQLIKNYQASLYRSPTPAPAPAVVGDPWIIDIYKTVYNRTPNATELRTSNYNNGRWGSYDELKQYIVQYQNKLKSNARPRERGLDPRTGNPVNPGNNVIAPGGGNVIAPGGGNVIAPGGGNVIAPGGGNVIAPGGGNVIAPGGGNVVSGGGGN